MSAPSPCHIGLPGRGRLTFPRIGRGAKERIPCSPEQCVCGRHRTAHRDGDARSGTWPKEPGARSQEPAVSLSAWPEQKRQTKCGEPSKFKLMQPTSQPANQASKQMRNCTDTQASQSLSCNPVWVGGLDSTLHIGVCVCHILCRRGRQRPAGCVRSKWQNTVPPSSPLARPTSKQAAGQGILDE